MDWWILCGPQAIQGWEKLFCLPEENFGHLTIYVWNWKEFLKSVFAYLHSFAWLTWNFGAIPHWVEMSFFTKGCRDSLNKPVRFAKCWREMPEISKHGFNSHRHDKTRRKLGWWLQGPIQLIGWASAIWREIHPFWSTKILDLSHMCCF